MTQLDAALEGYAEQQFLDGASKYVLTCALQNCNIEYPMWPTSCRSNYPMTKAAKRGWGNLEPSSSRDPCPLEIAYLIAFDMLLRGLPYFAAAVVLCFDTNGRVCSLTADNVIPPAKGVGKRYSFWTLLLHPHELGEPSKVGEFNDSLVVGSAGREWVGSLLGRIYVLHTDMSCSCLFPFTLAQFEKQFKSSVANLKLQKLKLTPHCLRHGGASHDYLMSHRTLQDIQQRGCWSSFESVRRYAKHCRVSKQLHLLTVPQQRAAKQASLELPAALAKAFQ